MKYSLPISFLSLLLFGSLTASEENSAVTAITELNGNSKASDSWDLVVDADKKPVLLRRFKANIPSELHQEDNLKESVVMITSLPQQDGWFKSTAKLLFFWKSNN